MQLLSLPVERTWDGQPVDARERVLVRVRPRPECLEVRLEAPFHRDPVPAAPAGPTPRLWEHEVVELFLAADGTAPAEPVPYTEIEMGPHGHFLVLQLRGARQVVQEGLRIPYACAVLDDRRWRAAAWLPWELLPEPPLRVNIYAIHGQGAARRHLAMAPVPGSAPDFHQPDRFVPLAVERPRRRE